MNELTTLAKFIYTTAVQDSTYFNLCGNKFREEIIPIGVKVNTPTAMFVGGTNKDVRGAFGYRLFTKSIYQIKAVVEGDDFKVLAPIANAIDRLFDWQNQIDPNAGRPISQVQFADPDDPTLQIMVMCMIKNGSIKYSTFTDGVNYCHLGGQYLIEHYYLSPPFTTLPLQLRTDNAHSLIIKTSGSIAKPALSEYTFFLDTSIQPLTIVLFAATGSLNKYHFVNTGANSATIILSANDTIDGTQTSFVVPAYSTETITDTLSGQWTSEFGSSVIVVTPPPTTTRQVFGFSDPSNMPYTPIFNNYGEDFPLAINENSTVIYSQVKNMGLDGLIVDIGVTASNMTERLQQGQALGFSVAPCIDIGYMPGSPTTAQYQTAVITGITNYVSLASTGNSGSPYTSAQKVGNQFVVYTYNNTSLLPADWAVINATLLEAGINIYWIGDVSGAYLTNSSSTNNQTILDFMATFDAAYPFGPVGASPTYLTGLAQAGKPFGTSMQPGYWRTNVSWTDAQGTATYDSQWSIAETLSFIQFPGQCNFAVVSTWDDGSEETYNIESSIWSATRLYLTAWRSAEFRGDPRPWTDERMCVTSPQCVWDGGNILLELLVFNPTNQRLRAIGNVRNANGDSISGQFTNIIGPGVGRITTKITNNTTLRASCLSNGVSNLHVYATLEDDLTGVQIIGMEGPRTTLFPNAAPSSPPRIEYYSITSTRSRTTLPTGSVNIKTDGTTQVTMSPTGSGTCKVLTLVHNTRMAYTTLQNSSYAGGSVNNLTFVEPNRNADDRGFGSSPPGADGYYVQQINTDWSMSWSNALPVTNIG